MAKTAKKATITRRAKSPAGRTPKARKHAPHPDDRIDGCLCDVEVPASLYTRDEDLPPAKGGVAKR